MNLDDVKEILELVKEHDLAEFELEREGLKIRIRKDAGGSVVAAPAASHGVAAPSPSPGPPPSASLMAAPGPGEDDALEFAIVKSPIVGTFYRAPEPGAPSFAEVGARVKKGQVLCIIEAMKLMNEIESEFDGEVMKVYVENGQPVQFGERLFAIKAS
jgi:acetyl-CoA carboxylase biotin carboxyl carrier protein